MSNGDDWLRRQEAEARGETVIHPQTQGAIGCLVVAVLAILVCMWAFSEDDEKAADPSVEAQKVGYDRFQAIVMRYAGQYREGVNEIQQTDMRFSRGKELCTIDTKLFMGDATISSIRTDKGGDASVMFETPTGIELQTHDDVERGSVPHAKLSHMAIGQRVAVQFRFVDDKKDCFFSERWTERNNMTKPRFLIDLVDVGG